MDKKFKIKVLSDCIDCNKKNKSLSFDIASILSLFKGIIDSIFPNAFPHKLTAQDWQSIWSQTMPRSGRLSNLFKQYMQSAIQNASDLDNIQKFTPNFIYFYSSQICGIPDRSFTTPEQAAKCTQVFYDTINKEQSGTSINTSGINFDVNSFLWIGLLAGGLYMLSENKKGRKK